MATQRRAAWLLALIVTCFVGGPMHSVARFVTVEDMKAGASVPSSGFAVDLMQYHHSNSPYAKPNITLEERVEIAVKSSLARGRYFHNKIYGETSDVDDKAVFTSPVYSIEGSYLMQIALGTPARTFVAIADTGSDLVWVQCAFCQRCFPEPDPIFDPAASSSYALLPCFGNAFCSATPTQQPCSPTGTCIYLYGYGDQSTTAGDLASETLTLTTTSGTPQAIPYFAFGCGHNNQGTFRATDGLVGLGQGPLSLVAQIDAQIGGVFSYCLVDFYSAITRTSPLLLGSPGPLLLQYTPLLTNIVNPSFYYVSLVGITVGGIPVPYPPDTFQIGSDGRGGLILDSGTTLTLLDTRAFTPFVNLLQSQITYPVVDGSSAGFDVCYNIAGVANPTFPLVVFQFQGLDVALPANNVFLQVDNVGDVCLAFTGSSGLSIYGNIAQQNFQIAYDRANRRVGFAPTIC